MDKDIAATTGVKRNFIYDGRFEVTHFTDPEFNDEFALAIFDEIRKTKTQELANGSPGIISVIDIGAGSGDMLYETSLLVRDNGIGNVNFYGVDIHEDKIIEGKKRRNDPLENIQFHISDIFQFDLRQFNHPIILTQRALTHYFVSRHEQNFNIRLPHTLPSAYTPEQMSLFKYYLSELPVNSKIMDFVSTGEDIIGLRRLAFVLNAITEGKQYNFLTEEAYIQMIAECTTGRRELKLANNILMQTENGYRDISILYDRYGNGMPEEQFSRIVLDKYKLATDMYPGGTSFVETVDGGSNLLFKIKYRLFTSLVQQV